MPTGPTYRRGFHQRLYRLIGRVKRELGRVTGDRRVEAIGEAEAQAARRPTSEEIRRAEQSVKRHYVEHEG